MLKLSQKAMFQIFVRRKIRIFCRWTSFVSKLLRLKKKKKKKRNAFCFEFFAIDFVLNCLRVEKIEISFYVIEENSNLQEKSF